MGVMFDSVRALNPSKSSWKIMVKIIRLWKCYSQHNFIDSIDMVLLDSNGDSIHATVNGELVINFDQFIQEGDSRIFINFSLSQSCGSYRFTQHPYKISFDDSTRVQNCEELPYRLTGFKPVNFRDILDGSLNPEYLIDVIGQVVEITHVEIVSLNGKDTEKIKLMLRNAENVRLPLVIWGKVALDLSQAVRVMCDNTLICVLKFGKIKAWKANRSVCNTFNVSAISINPCTVEVDEFAKLLPKGKVPLAIVPSKTLSMVSLIADEEEFFVHTQQKTISEILETRKVERCFVRCTIVAINNDMGWYYMSCKMCGTKIDMLHNNISLGGTFELDRRCMIYCTVCKVLNPKLKLRYKLHFVVLDNTSHTKLLVIDDVALQLLQQPSFHPTTHKTNEILEPDFLRNALNNVVGNTYLFKIIIDKVNYQYEDDTYKVHKIISNPSMMNDFDVSLYPKGASNTFYPFCGDRKVQSEIIESSAVECKSFGKTCAKRRGSPNDSFEAFFNQENENNLGTSESFKRVKTEPSG